MAWAPAHHPRRMRATYRRLKGTCLSGVFRRRKRMPDLFEAFRRLRACYPHLRLFVILDNLHGTHDHPRFLALLRRLTFRRCGRRRRRPG
jgi:hypothetical protein